MTALVALISASIVWLHVITEKVYEIEQVVPINYLPPSPSFTIANKLPNFAVVKISGKGKELLKVLINNGEVIIDCSKFSYGNREYKISPSDIHLPSRALGVEEIISPQKIAIKIDRFASRKIPIKPQFSVIPARGFILSSEPEIIPSEVEVIGPEDLIGEIEFASTQEDTLSGFNISTTARVPLKVPSEFVQFVPGTVIVKVAVEPIVQKEITGVPVSLRGFPPDISGALEPSQIAVTVAGSSLSVKNTSAKDIMVVVNYQQIVQEGSENIVPEISAPAQVSVIGIKPSTVRFKEQ